MKLAICLVGAASLLVSGCTSTGTSFGLPAAALEAVDVTSLATVTAALSKRRLDYVKAANGAANGTQLFDVPSLVAATAGVGAAAFGLKNDLAPAAGTLAAGALGFRGYYNSGSRYPTYVGAARGLSCLEQIGLGLTTLEFADVVNDWSLLAVDTNLPDDARQEARSQATRFRSTPHRLATAATRIDDEAIRKLAAPSAPNLAGLYQTYETAVRSSQQQSAADEAARANTTDAAKGEERQIIQLNAQLPGLLATGTDEAKASARREMEARLATANSLRKVEDLLSRTSLLSAISELDARIEQCVALAV